MRRRSSQSKSSFRSANARGLRATLESPFYYCVSLAMKSLIILFQAMLVLLVGFASCFVHARQPAGAQAANGVVMLPSLPANAIDQLDDANDTSVQVQGNVAELKQMIETGLLTEMRVTFNGSYGASMYFYPQDMVYYVALFQNKNFWRVVKTQDNPHAETVYAQFARKSYTLADGELLQAQLQAQKLLLDRVIAVSNDRARRLTADLVVAQAQESQVSQRQQQMQAESAARQNEKMIAERKLRLLQDRVRQLQSQNEAGLSQ
jgi:Protein of unknown function (DUF2968)